MTDAEWIEVLVREGEDRGFLFGFACGICVGFLGGVGLVLIWSL